MLIAGVILFSTYIGVSAMEGPFVEWRARGAGESAAQGRCVELTRAGAEVGALTAARRLVDQMHRRECAASGRTPASWPKAVRGVGRLKAAAAS